MQCHSGQSTFSNSVSQWNATLDTMFLRLICCFQLWGKTSPASMICQKRLKHEWSNTHTHTHTLTYSKIYWTFTLTYIYTACKKRKKKKASTTCKQHARTEYSHEGKQRSTHKHRFTMLLFSPAVHGNAVVSSLTMSSSSLLTGLQVLASLRLPWNAGGLCRIDGLDIEVTIMDDVVLNAGLGDDSLITLPSCEGREKNAFNHLDLQR